MRKNNLIDAWWGPVVAIIMMIAGIVLIIYSVMGILRPQPTCEMTFEDWSAQDAWIAGLRDSAVEPVDGK